MVNVASDNSYMVFLWQNILERRKLQDFNYYKLLFLRKKEKNVSLIYFREIGRYIFNIFLREEFYIILCIQPKRIENTVCFNVILLTCSLK